MNPQQYVITIFLLIGFFYSHSQNQPNQLSLSGQWKLTWADGHHGPKTVAALAAQRPVNDELKYLEVTVPGEIHDVFIREGIIGDPNVGVNTLYSNWVADQYYQYYKEFIAPQEIAGKEVWLVFDQLDYAAGIFVNGKETGSHKNAHIPCKLNVTGHIKPGKNELVVTIESGLFDVAEKEGEKYGYIRGFQQAVDKRHYLRKAQYQFNWDWNQKYINVGITGDVKLQWADVLRLDQTVVTHSISSDLTEAEITVKHFIEGVQENEPVEVAVKIPETGQEIVKAFKLKKGIDGYQVEFKIQQPKLWWPKGYGGQHRYTIISEIKHNGNVIATDIRKTGIRKVEVDQSVHPERGTYFTIHINNVPVFMKGANWVPPEMVYSKISKQKLDTLIQLAMDANFNLLRIWGGGIYAGNELLDLCDEKGIVVWHDFLFACSIYPGDDDEFYDEIRKETTWAVREFSHHPSVIVWGGNNENEWIYWDGSADKKPMADYVIYEHLLPLTLINEGVDVFYWPSSPHSPDKIYPNDPYTGDQHPWNVGFGPDGINFWAYRGYEDRFANEGGVLGATSPATIKQMLGKDQYSLRSFAWEHHDNLMNFRKNELGYTYKSFEFFLGKKYDEVPLEDYLFGSALLQAEGLTEYIYNYRRRKFSSSAAIFWMYADSWPVTHGWTIVDYYLRKKLAFHPVRRAFDEVVAVVVKEDDNIAIYGVNDGLKEWKGYLRHGIFNLDGEKPMDETIKVRIPANSSKKLAAFPLERLNDSNFNNTGSFAVLLKDGETVCQNKLLLSYYKNLNLHQPEIDVKLEGEYAVFTSDVFVWGAAIDINGESDVADNCFDLIPGIPYRISWNSKEPPVVLKSGNEL